MRRGEVWFINLDPTIGSEIRKTRPAVIVSDNDVGILPLRVIVPITDWKERFKVAKWLVRLEPTRLNGLAKTSAADTFQIRSVAQQRFVKRVGELESRKMKEIEEALAVVLSIG